MNSITLAEERDVRPLRKAVPSLLDIELIVEPPSVIRRVDGSVAAISVVLPDNVATDALCDVLPFVPHQEGERLNRSPSDSKTFGARQRLHRNRLDFGSRSALDFDPLWSRVTRAMVPIAEYLDSIYSSVCPEQHARQLARIQALPAFWRWSHGWTSGIFNFGALRLHTDRYNVPESFNGIWWARERVSGGLLAFPGWGIAFPAEHRHAVLHDPFAMHGVTPVHGNGHRVSTAFYAIRGFENYGTPAQELRRGQGAKT